MRCRFFLASLLWWVAGPALAQTRPLQTEEATTAPAGTLAFETGFDFIQVEPNFVTGRTRDRWAGPLLRLVYSPAGNVEVDLEWVARVGARNDPDFGNVSDFGDVTLRTKLRFAEEGPGRPAFGARFAVSLPETNSLHGLGPNTFRMSAEFILSKTLGRLALHANAGVAIQDKPLAAHAQSDFLSYGLSASRSVGSRWAFLAEVAGLGVGKGYPGADRHAEARAGFRYSSSERLRWDAALRRGLEAADGHWGFTLGLHWTLRRGS